LDSLLVRACLTRAIPFQEASIFNPFFAEFPGSGIYHPILPREYSLLKVAREFDPVQHLALSILLIAKIIGTPAA
jgi:hypothetical protein